MSRRPKAPPAGSPATRGALLIIAAVLLGAGLLANGFRDDNVVAGSGSATQTTRTTAPGGTGTTVAQAHDPAQVKVLILNGSGKSGVAKAAKDQLAAANYTVLEPGNATGGTITASIVYFVPGYDADAQTIAAKLGLATTAVQPLPTPLPATIADAQGATVVVIIGTDAPVAGGAGAGTTSSTTPTTAAN